MSACARATAIGAGTGMPAEATATPSRRTLRGHSACLSPRAYPVGSELQTGAGETRAPDSPAADDASGSICYRGT